MGTNNAVEMNTAIRLIRNRQQMINQEIVDNGGAPSIKALEKLLAKKEMSIRMADRILQAMDYRIAVVPDGANLPEGSFYIRSGFIGNRKLSADVPDTMITLAEKYFGEIDQE